MKPLTIATTPEIIAAAAASREKCADRCVTCPIALAMKEATGFEFLVSESAIELSRDLESEITTPREVADYIRLADRSKDRDIQPRSFTFDVPDEWLGKVEV